MTAISDHDIEAIRRAAEALDYTTSRLCYPQLDHQQLLERFGSEKQLVDALYEMADKLQATCLDEQPSGAKT